MKLKNIMHLSMLMLSCTAPIITHTEQPAAMAGLPGMPPMNDASATPGLPGMPKMSDAEMKALEEFTRYFESLPEAEQQKIIDEALQMATQIDEAIQKMTPEERAQFEADLERELQNIFSEENMPMPMAQPEAPKKLDEPKKAVSIKEEREALKKLLKEMVTFIEKSIKKIDTLNDATKNRTHDVRWIGQKDSLETLKKYCVLAQEKEAILNVIIDKDHTLLRTHIDTLNKALEKIAQENTSLKNDVSDKNNQLPEAKSPDIKELLTTLEQINEIDQVTWGIKNIARTHAPDEFKKLNPNEAVSSPSSPTKTPAVEEKNTSARSLDNTVPKKASSAEVDKAISSLKTALEVNAVTDTLKTYTQLVVSDKGAQEALAKARSLNRMIESSRLMELTATISLSAPLDQQKRNKLNTASINELKDALSLATTDTIQKNITEISDKHAEAKNILTELHKTLTTLKKQLS